MDRDRDLPAHGVPARAMTGTPVPLPASRGAGDAGGVASSPGGASRLRGSITTGAELLWATLEELGVAVVFGHPGGQVLPAYDPLMASRVRHLLVRHEQDAAHAAAGYAHATGRPGVVLATSGPGATNLVTGIADAFRDSIPLLAITGQVRRDVYGTDAFQEADIVSIVTPVTKHAMRVNSADDVGEAIRAAFHLAETGRHGPTLVDIPKDVLEEGAQPPTPPSNPSVARRPRGHRRAVAAVVDELERARRPVAYVGGGAIRSDATALLRDFVERQQLPTVTTLMARGAIPDAHPLTLGMPGMHGHPVATMALQRADLVVALGARFDDRVIGDPATFARHARVAHIDIDAAEINKIRRADAPVVGDLKDVLHQLVRSRRPDTSHRAAWLNELEQLRQRHPIPRTLPADPQCIDPVEAIRAIRAVYGPDAIYTAGVGQHQMWAAQHLDLVRPRQWINSGGLGTMGFALPAALGAKAAEPQRRVVAIEGDGGFQMTCRELATSIQHDLPVTVCVLDNRSLGMVRQQQQLLFDGRHSQVDLPPTPDIVRLAAAYGIQGFRIDHAADLRRTLQRAADIEEQPVVIHIVIDRDAMVLPFIPAGASNDRIFSSLGQWSTHLRTLASSNAKAARE